MDDRSTILRVRSQIRSVNRRLAMGNVAPCNADRALWGELAVVSFASVTGLGEDVRSDPETVLSDLLADLMHWCDARETRTCVSGPVDYESALERAREHYSKERATEPQRAK
jgi:hypothetical protein